MTIAAHRPLNLAITLDMTSIVSGTTYFCKILMLIVLFASVVHKQYTHWQSKKI